MKPVIIEAIREVLQEEVCTRLDKLEEKVDELYEMKHILLDHQEKIKDLENSLDFTDNQIKEIKNELLPNLEKKYEEIITNICMNALDMDTHRRKWTVIINGLHGEAGEAEPITRTKVRSFACNKLKIPGADTHSFSACHRLAQKENAGIIVKFVDLSEKNAWLENAKNLKNCQDKISLSPDIHPVLRQLKRDILQKRKDLPPDQRQGANIKYLPSWPYVCLKIRNGTTKNHSISKKTIVESYLQRV